MGASGGWREELTWRRFAVVAAICVVVSTQVLFQPSLLEWEPAAILRGWFDFFAEVFACGLAMWLAFVAVQSVMEPSRSRAVVLAVALWAAAAVGYAIVTLALEPEGFRPPLAQMAGDALRWALMGGMVTLAVTHVRRSLQTAAQIQHTELERSALARRAAEAQVQVLEARIEPHFLFNTLAHVKRLYAVAPASGGEMLASLHAYLRSALPRMRDPHPTLGSEVDLVEAYLKVLRMRMGSRLEFAIDVPPALRSHAFPPMMLITLAENAIKHGVQPLPEGGAIAIAARSEAGILEVEVGDTGAGFQAGPSGSGTGLANIRERLRAAYAGRASLALARNHPRGFVARLRIPMAA